MLTAILILVFLVVVAASWFQGLWGNMLTIINILLAGLIALNYFEPLATQLEKSSPGNASLWDFVCLWSLFILSFVLLRVISDLLSRRRLTFNIWVEMVGRSILAIWIGWMTVGFMCVSIHTAPLAAHPFGGSFQPTPSAGNFMGLAPGRQWLALMQSRSRGALSRGDDSATSRYPEDKGKRVFDPNSEFIIRYYHRRQALEQQ